MAAAADFTLSGTAMLTIAARSTTGAGTVAAAAGAAASAGDFTLSATTTLTFAANATASTGLVTVTATDNVVDAPDKGVTVSGTASDNLNRTNDPPVVTLTVDDDEAAPGVTLSLTPTSVSENGGVATVAAVLSHPSAEPTTVMAVAGAYAAGPDAVIVIAVGATAAASDTATLRAADDAVHQGSAGRGVTVTASAANGHGAGALLTLEDDDALPGASLVLAPASISETDGVSTVTTVLPHRTARATTLTVCGTARCREPGRPAPPCDRSAMSVADFPQGDEVLAASASGVWTTSAQHPDRGVPRQSGFRISRRIRIRIGGSSLHHAIDANPPGNVSRTLHPKSPGLQPSRIRWPGSRRSSYARHRSTWCPSTAGGFRRYDRSAATQVGPGGGHR